MKTPIRLLAPLVALASGAAHLGAQGFPPPPDRDGQGLRRPGPPPGGGRGEMRPPGRGRGERGGGGPRPDELGAAELDLGEPGIAWYPKLEDGLAEAKRSNRPILFMSVASQCGGVPGVF